MFSIVETNNDKKMIDSLMKLNDVTSDKGLVLKYEEIVMIIERKNDTLKNLGLIEIGKSVIDDIVYAFYDSSYIDSDNYFETINELVSIFYEYQFEFSGYLSDEEIINYMRECFDKCGGSTLLLGSLFFDELNSKIKFGDLYE